MKKHILISYSNTGSGHKTPAEAIADTLEELYPGQYRITLSDFFTEAGEKDFDQFICKSWDWLLKHPRVNFFNIMLSHALAPWTHHFLPALNRKVWLSSMEYINKIRPDIIFTTHFYCQNVALDARKKYSLNYPVITLNPDSFETFPQWDRRGDLLLVNSSMALEKALKLRHKKEKLIQVPQALRKSFDSVQKESKSEIRARLGLEDRFTIFLSDGGQGIGIMEHCVKALAESGLSINIICICGRNQHLLEKLKALKPKYKHISLLVHGYTENMAELLSASDLFSGKGGPASVIEALTMKIPVVITYAVNTAETNTRTFFTKKEMAWNCPSASKLVHLVQELIAHPQKYQNAVKAIKSSDFFHNGSPIIAKIIVNALEKSLLSSLS